MKPVLKFSAVAALGVAAFGTAVYGVPSSRRNAAAENSIEHGRHLVKIMSCNDCHTHGYSQVDGELPENEWLAGDDLGYRGAWGTTYPANLRLLMRSLSEEQWVLLAKNGKARPPMPWFNLHALSDQDLRDMYRFVVSLGPKGQAVPDYVPPGAEVKTAVVDFPH